MFHLYIYILKFELCVFKFLNFNKIFNNSMEELQDELSNEIRERTLQLFGKYLGYEEQQRANYKEVIISLIFRA